MFILGLGTFLSVFFLKSFLAGALTLGGLTFIYTIYGNIIGPMYGFVWGLRGFYRSMADFQDLFEYGKIENEIKR
jgi:ABC-type multidrug transport system fused ATPase/permease subunit